MLHSAMWRDALLLLAAAPLVYYALATLVAMRFFKRERARVLPDFTPAVSILKPVRGVDFGSYENFASFCRQEYRDYEILFAVNDDTDPAVPVIRRIIAEFPEHRIRLLVGAEHLGANRKVNKLARLAGEAQNEVLVLTDGDVRVGPHFLREVVAPLADNKVGAVTSFYRGIAEKNIGAEIEAVGASSDFFAGVLMAGWTEGISFALGASIATTKEWLGKMGGFDHHQSRRPSRTFTRSCLDHVSRANPAQLLGPSSALGAHGALVQAAVLYRASLHPRPSLGSVCRARRADKMDRGRLRAWLLDPALCDGLDGGYLGAWRRSPAPENLAGAAAGCCPFRGLAREFRFESYSLGQPRICDSPGPNGARCGR